MVRLFESEYIGKAHISSHFCRCEFCKRLTVLNTYTTTRFAKLLNMPIFPLGKLQIVDECSHCGNRATTSARKYSKERKRNLAVMMKGFANEPDNPDNCAHALHTLMVYNMKSWFHDVQKSYGIRFETNMHIQLLIAQGLSRFGEYQQAMIYCRKAIVLGGGRRAEELLDFCETLLEASDGRNNLEALRIQPESTLKAYIPLATITTALIVYLIVIGISSLQYYKAWIVNGALYSYSFTLDDQTYTLDPGETREIRLRLGSHKLKTLNKPAKQFDYAVPFLRQLLNKHLMVINPDGVALLAVRPENTSAPEYSTAGQIRLFPGLKHPLRGLRLIESPSSKTDTIGLYRPDSHMEMVELMQRLKLPESAHSYANNALKTTPKTPESKQLIPVALEGLDDTATQNFLKSGLDLIPVQLSWHLHYQDYMQNMHPEVDLQKEYKTRYELHPQEPESCYLLARVTPGKESAYKFYALSDENNGMHGLGLYTIARDLYIRGEFTKALPYAREAVKLNPGNQTYRKQEENIYLALQDYTTLLKDIIEKIGSQVPSAENAEKMVLYLSRCGHIQEAADMVTHLAKTDHALQSRLDAIRYYVAKNLRDYLNCIEDARNPHAQVEIWLHEGKLSELADLFGKSPSTTVLDHLVLYCASRQDDVLNIAEMQLEKAIAKLSLQEEGGSKAAMLLQGTDAPSVAEVKELDLEAPEKAALLIVLGYLFPDQQKQFNELARMYNFVPAYPQYLLNQWIKEIEKKEQTGR